MLQPYTYLLINFFTAIVCFIASFDKRIEFNRHFDSFFKAAIVVALPFIAWDIWFEHHGIWWFDTNYTLGIVMAGLPMEEWLFFICIPFSCVFTFYCLDRFWDLSRFNVFNNIIVFTMIVGCSVVALLYYSKLYTLITAIAATITLIYLHFIAKKEWIGQASLVYLLLLPGFFMVNGILTGTGINSPVVNYNNEEILKVRLLTIPVEDTVYGYTQFLLLIYFFKQFQHKHNEKQASY